jgi:eukaryotic-like serine/threonine-protein kinase
LLDFGIAKLKVTGELDRGLTRPGVIMGTPEYMAPEQAYSADAVDVRADIFSLGVIIFEMLAGRRPVGGDEPHQIASSYLSGQIAQLSDLAPHVPPDLAQVIHKAMGPKPPDRYTTLADFRAALQPFAAAAHAPSAGAPVVTPAPGAVAQNNGTTVPPTGQASPIPKTLPPADETPPPGVVGSAVTPQPASPPGQIATPLGGFEAKSPGAGGTAIGAPLPVVGQDGTTPAQPLPNAFDSNQRPGGTAIGASLEQSNGGGYNAPSGGYAQAPVHATPGGWQPQQAAYQQPPAYGQTPGYVQPPGPTATKERSGGAGILVMLLIAFIVTGVVMGGVYLSQKLNHTDEGTDATATVPPPPTTVTADTPTATQTPATGAITSPPPPFTNTTPVQQQTQTSPTPTGPKPPPSGTGTSPTPSGTATNSAPTTFPPPFGSVPWQLPSGLPTGIPLPPFLGGGQPTASSPPTSRPPTTSRPPSSSAPPTSSSGRPQIIIRFPKKP